MNDLIKFFKKPTADNTAIDTLRDSARYFFITYFFCIFFIIISGIFILLVEYILKSHFHIPSPRISYNETMNKVYRQYRGYNFLIIVLAAPIYEELIFRLYLNLKKVAVSISFSLLVFGLTGPIWAWVSIENLAWRIGLVICIFILLQLIIKKSMLLKLKEDYFLYVYYFSVLLFAFIHISNFRPYDRRILFIYPLFILPQIGMGLSLGYIRIKLKNGLIWAILFHACINLQGILFHKI